MCDDERTALNPNIEKTARKGPTITKKTVIKLSNLIDGYIVGTVKAELPSCITATYHVNAKRIAAAVRKQMPMAVDLSETNCPACGQLWEYAEWRNTEYCCLCGQKLKHRVPELSREFTGLNGEDYAEYKKEYETKDAEWQRLRGEDNASDN